MNGDAPEQTVPTTWPELIEQEGPLVEESFEIIDEVPDEVADLRPHRIVANSFAGIESTLAAAAVLFGPERCRRYFEILDPFLPRAVAEIDEGIDDRTRIPAIFVISYLNVARCCGWPLTDEIAGAEQRWLDALARETARLDELDRQTLAFDALAAHRPELVGTFLGSAPAESFAPGRVFDFNAAGLARYLASAMRDGESYSDVQPAWANFVTRFPHKLAARTVGWPELIAVARAVLVHFGLQPEGDVAKTVRAYIST